MTMTAASSPFNMPSIGGGTRLLSGDFNGDGKSDLFVINYDWPTGARASTYAVLLGDGQGRYTVAQNVTTTDFSFPGRPLVGDFNHDGRDDIFVGTYGNELLQTGAVDIVLMGSPSGAMTEYRGLGAIKTWAHGSSVGDINNDGYADILNGGIGNLGSSVWLNNTQGGFSLSSTTLPSLFPYFQTANVWSTLIADLNGDGRNDIVVGHSGGEYALQPYGYSGTGAPATVFYATTNGGWTGAALPSGIFGVVNTDTVNIAQGDFDGDGRVDLLLANYDKGAFVENGKVVYTGDANSGSNEGTFTAGGYTLTKAGMDNRELQLLLNKESGWVDASANLLSGNIPTLDYLTTVQAIDLDGDGDLDIAGTVAGQLTAARTGPFIWVNDGKGHFSAVNTQGFDASLASSVWDWGYTDFSGAGDWRMFASLSTDAVWPQSEIHLSGPLLQKVGIGGSSANDYLHSDQSVTTQVFAHGGNDRLVFEGLSARADLGAGDDSIAAGSGNAIIVGGAGNDTIDGGAGTDTAVYLGSKAAFAVSRTAGGFEVLDRVGIEGRDTLTNVEKLQFSDGAIDLTVAAPTVALGNLAAYGNGNKVLTGAAQGGATVHIFNGGISVGSVVADAAGVWKFDAGAMTGASYSLSAESVDANGTSTYRAQLLAYTRGSDGRDRIDAPAGTSVIDGKEGLDTVVLKDLATNYVIAAASGGFTLAGRNGAGNSMLVGVERVMFNDGAVAFDIDGTAGKAFRIYQAAFARTPDKGGLGFWINAMDNGVSLASVAQGFTDAKEFHDVYGANPTNREIIEKFYVNVLHRPGEQAGIDFWVGVLDQKAATVAEVLMGFSEGSENQAALVGVTANGIAYQPFG
jgi:hypothetical protein